MREFKFRYWDTANGNWEKKFHYFDLEPKDSQVVGCGVIILPLDRPNRYVIQQFTGLKDKNGMDLYEGDILEAVGRRFETKWSFIGGHWEFIDHKNRTGDIIYNMPTEIKIVGNIFENPELLS